MSLFAWKWPFLGTKWNLCNPKSRATGVSRGVVGDKNTPGARFNSPGRHDLGNPGKVAFYLHFWAPCNFFPPHHSFFLQKIKNLHPTPLGYRGVLAASGYRISASITLQSYMGWGFWERTEKVGLLKFYPLLHTAESNFSCNFFSALANPLKSTHFPDP